VIAAVHAVARSAAGDLEGGIQAARRAVDIDPSQAVTRFMYGTVLIYAGQNAAAIDELREARRLAPGILPVLGALGYSLVKTGQDKEARTILAELRADESRFGVKPAIAKILVAMGDVNGAIAALQKAAKERDGFFSSEPLGTPLFEPVRRHPAFPALQKELGLDGAAFRK
jgi:Flp pilus assembly protein TadD